MAVKKRNLTEIAEKRQGEVLWKRLSFETDVVMRNFQVRRMGDTLDFYILRPMFKAIEKENGIYSPFLPIGYKYFVNYDSFEAFTDRRDWKTTSINLWKQVCAKIYFVSPPDVIEYDEVPDDVGVIHTDISKFAALAHTPDDLEIKIIKSAPNFEVTPSWGMLTSIVAQLPHLTEDDLNVYGRNLLDSEPTPRKRIKKLKKRKKK